MLCAVCDTVCVCVCDTVCVCVSATFNLINQVQITLNEATHVHTYLAIEQGHCTEDEQYSTGYM